MTESIVCRGKTVQYQNDETVFLTTSKTTWKGQLLLEEVLDLGGSSGFLAVVEFGLNDPWNLFVLYSYMILEPIH